ncbi:MAG: hypothetical protein KF729_14140 [Sandaracinaceae bacterium]|nr:hypothetical protein [Sandaracinaceae bacterium]
MRASLILSLSLLASACAASYSAGVDGDKPISMLTVAEARLACTNLSAHLQDQFGGDRRDRFNCYVRALSTTLTPDECRVAFDACMAAPPAGPLNIEPIDCSTAGPDPSCSARVSEVEDCLNASVDAFRERIDGVDCAIAGDAAALMRVQDPIPARAECTRLREVCPSYADGPFASDDGPPPEG